MRRTVPFGGWMITVALLLCGCSGIQGRSAFEEADSLFGRGEYEASLNRYAEVMAAHPGAGDRALFEMGIIHAHPKNGRKDYGKARECFERLVREYPASSYRQDSERMTIYLDTVAARDATIAAREQQLKSLRQDLEAGQHEIAALQKRLRELEQKVFDLATRRGTIDRILVEKKERRLTLLSKGEALKSYRIALGGNPVGPKERQGDHKTPEGIYTIEGRNRESRYHLSLRISYPNERDRKRARERGVSPGGDIMIHGIKNGLSWVGDGHREVDWTQGCIAVTDDEIEEIARVTPDGTVVEIRP